MQKELEPKGHPKVLAWFDLLKQEVENYHGFDDCGKDEADHVLRISSARYMPELEEIRVWGSLSSLSSFSDARILEIPKREFCAVIAPWRNPSMMKTLLDPLFKAAPYFRGDEVEFDVTEDRYLSTRQILSNFSWDPSRWKQSFVEDFYRNEIYPSALSSIRQTIRRGSLNYIEGADIFGGDGEFAELLAQELPEDFDFRMHVIDRNLESLECAQERFAQKMDKFVVHDSRDLTEAGPLFEGFDRRPNLVTAIGGLCMAVVDRFDALEIARKVYQEIAEGGVFVLTGYTPVLLSSHDFRIMGFQVEQMTVPEKAIKEEKPYQVYVLRK